MNDLDQIAPHFRRAQLRWSHAPNLKSHYEAIATTYGGSGFSLIEQIKSFVESVCLTIIHDYGRQNELPLSLIHI